jgi:tRNA (adenine37-N6)-methyltransferase
MESSELLYTFLPGWWRYPGSTPLVFLIIQAGMVISMEPIAFVINQRNSPVDDDWGSLISEIHLASQVPDCAFDAIEGFSHLEIIYYFDQVEKDNIVFSGKPRGNPEYPEVGIFGQRKKDRPNRIGLSTVSLLGHEGRMIRVKWLDAICGTPVLDIKPVFREFEPQGPVIQPHWVIELMARYWK